MSDATSAPVRIDDHDAFIRAHTAPAAVPHAPEITLYLATEATDLWRKTEEELGEIGLPPPFWAFAWAGGQALARHILDNPQLVAGKRVLDFASGSGIVGIAAARAGAAEVEAVDIDPFSLSAIRLNAALNGVSLRTSGRNLLGEQKDGAWTDASWVDDGWDVILAGDICYERDLAARVIAWLEALAGRGAEVLIGDPGRSYLPKERLVQAATYEVPVTRELEDSEIKRTCVWRLRRD
ncbi:methyltransferase [Camelimonas abortus]|uniref:Class I SAM-dependent methyltransferase n=1 Tax=Camelimonas abortus TaxID=1017184 RepID=A0ABV7LCJ3_9HYPH